MHIASFGNFVIKFTKCCTGLNPSGLTCHVDGDGPEVEHVEDDERDVGDVGDSIVVVAATSDFELDSNAFGAEHGDLDMGYLQWSDYDDRFGGCGPVEPSISDVGLEYGCVRSVAWVIDD